MTATQTHVPLPMPASTPMMPARTVGEQLTELIDELRNVTEELAALRHALRG
jgi:hypothetical protein